MVLVEVEGITHAGGRHQRIAGFEKDAEKYATAQALGWTILRISPGLIRTGRGIRLIDDVLRRFAKAKGYL
jgi:very-short-patch-repair endonuclease